MDRPELRQLVKLKWDETSQGGRIFDELSKMEQDCLLRLAHELIAPLESECSISRMKLREIHRLTRSETLDTTPATGSTG